MQKEAGDKKIRQNTSQDRHKQEYFNVKKTMSDPLRNIYSRSFNVFIHKCILYLIKCHYKKSLLKVQNGKEVGLLNITKPSEKNYFRLFTLLN